MNLAPPATAARRHPDRSLLGDLASAVLAVALLVAAIVVPRRMAPAERDALHAETAPLYGIWEPHVGVGTPLAVVLAVLVVGWGPRLAQRLRWPWLLAGTAAVAVGWAMALLLVDGWQRGFVDHLEDSNEYLPTVRTIADVPAMVQDFSSRILEGVPGSWPTHVSGHPPGALLSYVALDRLGLDGEVPAGLAEVLVGCSAVVAVLVTVRVLADEQTARRAAPFLALAPAAIWVAVSADALFAGVVAWGIALLALAATRAVRWPTVAALASGLLLGYGIFLSYGLVLMGLVAVAVLVAARTVRPLLPAVAGALAVVAAFAAAGFWWLDGYHLVVDRYYQGIATERPFSYWGWANLASLLCAVGLATAAALHRVLAPARLRTRDGLSLLVLGAGLAVAAADLSALSKAETERIWLPFAVWLLAATAALPVRWQRGWLTVQALLALGVVHLVLTNW
ncbi:hypothetical protein [Rhodococcus sp. X156]|uniref:hypothetical protein n=1 Tax=Rhodococcus sp. X156 TaxID=2499145 RepID=UPI001F49BA4A|nr:hypothetical protein [Rhodococcus sp. X156]